MTDEMLDLARRNAAEAGAGNVEFLRGYIEDIPLEDETVDVVISNCVINLSADKPAVFDEIRRVLRPGGRIGITDVSWPMTNSLPIRSPSEAVGWGASQERSPSPSTGKGCRRQGSRTSRSRQPTLSPTECGRRRSGRKKPDHLTLRLRSR